VIEPVIIGDATLYNCDCLEAMRQMPDNAFDLAIVDPPYGIGENKGQHKSRNANRVDPRNGKPIICSHKGYTPKEWDNKIPDAEYFQELRRVSKNQIIWGGNYFLQHLPATPCMVVWDKCNGGSDFADCELAWTSFKTAVRLFRFMWSGFCQGSGVVSGHINQGNKALCEKRIHPVQKPATLYKWLLMNYAKEGDRILDTHHGSGSNAIACLDMGFSITAYELDEDYFKAAVERIDRAQQQGKLF
jgi:site-specific DNA-methyltransferase (adenine-specific)